MSRKPIDASLLYGKFIASIPEELLPGLKGLTVGWSRSETEIAKLANSDEIHGVVSSTDIKSMCRQPLVATITRVTRKMPNNWIGSHAIYYKPLLPYYDSEEQTVVSPAPALRQPYFFCFSARSFFASILQVARLNEERDPLARFQHIS